MTVRTIFLNALEIKDLASRATYLDEACAGDSVLRSQFESLLNNDSPAHSESVDSPAGVPTNLAFDKTIQHMTLREEQFEAISPSEALKKYLQPATRPGWLGALGHYEIEKILGTGAFGIVAKAFDEKLLRVIAIKVMNPELAMTSPPRKRFLREARAAAAVRHENIVGIHAVEEEPIPYLVMEYVGGSTLGHRLDQTGPLDVQEVLRIGQQLALGMAAAHSAHLIHRDIKPANILLEGGVEDRVKISDFGLARAIDDASMTQSNMIVGTPMFMAPEQARGEVLDHRADLFSLGSVLYQMVSGRPPFRAPNLVAILKRICDETQRPITDVLPGTPDWLGAIIDRLLEKKKENRYQSAKEVADLLARCQSDLKQNGKVTCVSVDHLGKRSVDYASADQLARTNHLAASSSLSAPKQPLVIWLFAFFGVLASVIVLANWLSPFASPWFSAKPEPLPKIEVPGGLDFDSKDERQDRMIAEWILGQGGSVTLRNRNGFIETISELPAEEFAVELVNVRGIPEFTVNDAVMLSRLPNLLSTAFIDTKLMPGAITALQAAPSLRDLSFYGQLTAASELVEVLSGNRTRGLSFINTMAGNELVSRMGELPHLCNLQVHGGNRLTHEALKGWNQKPPLQLQTFNWGGLPMEIDGIERVARLPSLQKIHFSHTRLSDESLLHLANCKTLANVELINVEGVTAYSLHALQKMLGDCRVYSTHRDQVTPMYGGQYNEAIHALLSRGWTLNVESNRQSSHGWVDHVSNLPAGEAIFVRDLGSPDWNQPTARSADEVDLQLLTILHGSQMTDEALKDFRSAPLLERLELGLDTLSTNSVQDFATARPEVLVIWKGTRLMPK